MLVPEGGDAGAGGGFVLENALMSPWLGKGGAGPGMQE